MREVEVHIVGYLKLFSSYFVLTYDIKSFWTNKTSAVLLDFGEKTNLKLKIVKISRYKEIQRPTTRALAPPQMFPVNPQKKHNNLHI